MPEKLVLPLGQHMGTPAQACVAIGDYVLRGQQIAKAAPGLSASLHAPTSGTITALQHEIVTHASELDDMCITLVPDHKDKARATRPLDIKTARSEQIAERIANSGIIGMGGAGFPSALKLPNKSIDTLIINGIECEPYISADDMLMREYSADIVNGIATLTRLLPIKRIFVAIEDNKLEAYLSFKDALEDAASSIACKEITVQQTPTQYPSGGERQLIQMLLGKEVPSGKPPVALGIVCLNVATVFAIGQAVYKDYPLTKRVVTLTGECMAKPHNIFCPIGVPVRHLLKLGQCNFNTLHTLIIGGPMMGVAIKNDAVPISKTTSCVIAGTIKEFPPPAKQQPCIRCGLCAEVCPASLLPQQLYWFARNLEYGKLQTHNLFDCIECGACSWVCPSNIPLVQYYRAAKSEIRHRQGVEQMAQGSKQRFDAHQNRIAQEKQALEERRKARRANKDINQNKRAKIAKAVQRTRTNNPPTE